VTRPHGFGGLKQLFLPRLCIKLNEKDLERVTRVITIFKGSRGQFWIALICSEQPKYRTMILVY
jgi:hypothetical protein